MFVMHNYCGMRFVDRKEETSKLTRMLEKEQTTFVVVYGRRRLGKSTLIKRVLKENDVYYLADESSAPHQRELLSKMIAQIIPDFDKVVYPDWETLFRTANHRTDNKFTLCIDEIPNLIKQSPELPSVLQKLIDEKTLKFTLIICGSSQALMYGLVLDANSPLYGRANAILKMTPIHLPYLQEALHTTDIGTIEEYAVWGGVPRYWELREDYPSLEEAIQEEIFSVNGTLYEEPAKLFKDDIKDIVQISTLLAFVASGSNRLSEIAARANQETTSLSRPLGKLVDMGYLEREIPFGENPKSSKKSLYKIVDPFLNFYYKFVVPNRSFIELGRTRPIANQMQVQFPGFTGECWERICRKTISGNEVDGICYGMASRWWGNISRDKRIGLDVVAESLDKKNLLVGECKWTGTEDASRLIHQLKKKASLLPFAEGHKIVPVLFLKEPAIHTEGCRIIYPKEIIELNR